MAWSTPSSRSTGDLITAAIWNQDVVDNPIALADTGLVWVIDGGGVAYATGEHRPLLVPFKATITQATLLHDQSSTTTIDIWKDTYANYPPTDADSITASAQVSTSTADKEQDGTLTGWTTAIATGDILLPNVDANDNATYSTLILKVQYS